MYSFVKDRNDVHLVIGIIICITGFIRDAYFSVDFNYYILDFHPHIIDPAINFMKNNPILAVILSYLLLLINAFYLEIINRKHNLISTFTRLPFLLYIAIVVSGIPLQHLFVTQAGIFMFILAIDKVYSTHKQRQLVFNYFDAAFFISLSALVYPKFIFLQSFVIISLIFLRSFRLREWILTLIGGLLPFIFQWALAYAFNWSTFWNLTTFAYPESTTIILEKFNRPTMIFWGIMILIGSIEMVKTIRKKKVASRRFFLILFILFIISSLGIVVNTVGFEVILIFAIPISFLISHHLIIISNRVSKMYYFLIILFVYMPFILKQIFSA